MMSWIVVNRASIIEQYHKGKSKLNNLNWLAFMLLVGKYILKNLQILQLWYIVVVVIEEPTWYYW